MQNFTSREKNVFSQEKKKRLNIEFESLQQASTGFNKEKQNERWGVIRV